MPKPAVFPDLSGCPLFAGLAADELAALLPTLRPQTRRYQKGEILLLTGEDAHHIGILISGRAEAYAEDPSGSRVLISELAAGQVLGEILASSVTAMSPVTVYAGEPSEIVFIPYRNILSLFGGGVSERVAHNFLKLMADKYLSLQRRLLLLRRKSLRARLAAFFLLLAEDADSFTVTLPFSKTAMADYLLADRSALSRELGRMAGDGLIRVCRRTVVLLSEARLRAYLQ